MGKPNEGMWNSSTHAMSDICSLAYRGNVPACDVIVPADAGAGDRTFETRGSPLQTSSADDVAWNRASPGRGRGRGALLQNRDVIHRNDEELKKQLRIANGLGYSNDLIEAKFQNASSNDLVHRTQPLSRETDTSSHGTTTQNTSTQQVEEEPEEEVEEVVVEEAEAEEEEEEVEEDRDDGGWNWETRTAEPAPNRIILKNVAMESLKRQKKAHLAVKVPSPTAPAPASPGVCELTPHASPAPKPKEDWRAENKAAERARIGSPKAKKWGRSTVAEPLLGDLKVEGNWSAFAPNTPTEPEETCLYVAPAPEPAAAVESPTMSLFEGQSQRGKKSKKKNQNVRVMYVPPPAREPAPNAAPAGYLMPTNGVSPLATRNSEYFPLGGRDMHRTFGNLFEQVGNNVIARDCKPYNRNGSFSLARDDFPQLK